MARDTDFKQNLCAGMQGYSLHAAVRCGTDERQALGQLFRYLTRPALANERVQTNAAGPGAPATAPTCACSSVSSPRDVMTELDYRVGQLVAALERAGQRDNTLIFFTSDGREFPHRPGRSGRLVDGARADPRWTGAGSSKTSRPCSGGWSP